MASSVVLGFKGSVAAGDKGDARAGQWLDEEGVLMAEWPSSMFPNQNELALAVAALALVTAVLMGALLLFVVRSGSLKVRRLLGVTSDGGSPAIPMNCTSLTRPPWYYTVVLLKTPSHHHPNRPNRRLRPSRDNPHLRPQRSQCRLRPFLRHVRGARAPRDLYLRPGNLQQGVLGVLREVASQLRRGPGRRHGEDLYIRDGVPLGNAVCILALVWLVFVGLSGLEGRETPYAVIGRSGVAGGSGWMLVGRLRVSYAMSILYIDLRSEYLHVSDTRKRLSV